MDIQQHEPVTDRLLTCVQCEDDFVWEANEIRYFVSKGLAQPKRCPRCREARRIALEFSKGGNR